MLNHLLKITKNIWLMPFLSMTLLMLSHLFFQKYAHYLFNKIDSIPNLNLIEQSAYIILMGVCGYWFFSRLICRVVSYLQDVAFFEKYPTVSIILPFFATVLKTLTFLILFNLVSQRLDLSEDLSFILNKISSIFIIAAISGILFKLIDIGEKLLLHHYTADGSGLITERKIYTQTMILKRVAYSIITVITVGAILVLFDNVRALGASVLTTAGVFGLVLTFTAQRSLGSIVSGLEIALTQPIKIGDKVLIEEEVGIIEEINFRSVIIKLWDWRRLIVPTNFFLEKPFQNWTRFENVSLIGTVYLYVDFTMPIDKLRNKFYSILKNSDLWDQDVSILRVNELQESVMQIKILASVRNSDDSDKLRAFIREELMSYIAINYPDSLPKTRYDEDRGIEKNGGQNIDAGKEKMLMES